VKTAPRPQPQEDKIGHIEAFQKGEQLYWQGQYQKALPFFQRAAKNHYPPAYLYLGCMHEFEQGVVKDHGESISWFSKAQAQETWFTEQAAKGNATGQRHLGGYYQFAAGAKKDLTKAVIWYRRAAEQGDARAQINLGACYDAGQGVTQDYAQAVSWYRQAAEREFAMAQCMLGVCYQQGKGVAQNYAQAVSWYRRAAEQGYAAAQYNLGYCYETGRGLSKTPQLAKQWYEKAAAQSNEDAITALAALLKANPSLASNPSSFFAASSRSKPDNKVEAKQALNNPPPVPPKPVPQKSAAPVVVDEKALGQLLKCVAEGEQNQAEALIKKDSKLLLAAGKVTDLSGRTFDNITAFQYALWAMDYHMWTMIQKYLPTEAQAKQHTMLESKGTAHGKHFDLQPLLEALKTYVDKHGTFFFNGVKHWSKKVGGAQKLLPAHVVNEYCRRDRQFKPCSSKWTSPLPRSRAVFNSELDNGSWFTPFSPSESLGVSFAFYRSAGWGRLAMASAATSDGGIAACGAAWPAEDLKSLQSLWNARTEQLKSLADSLAAESQSTLQVSPKK
jgi:TPR repeat protein